MTLSRRDEFAKAALTGLAANNCAADYSKGACNAALVERSVVLADALIAELDRTAPAPHDMAAKGGPRCGCGRPSVHEDGWCGTSGAWSSGR